MGPVGPAGVQGIQGLQGLEGAKGIPGDVGPQGLEGISDARWRGPLPVVDYSELVWNEETQSWSHKPNIQTPVVGKPAIEWDSWVLAEFAEKMLSEASRAASGAIGMDPDRTISAQAGEAAAKGEPWGMVVSDVLDVFDEGHTAAAFAAEVSPTRRCDPGIFRKLSK